MPLGPPDLSSVVESYSTPGTRRRPGAVTTNADGFRVAAAPTDQPSVGHIFPANGDTMSRFALQDVSGLFEVHSNTQLLAADPGGGALADQWLVDVPGRSPRVFTVVVSSVWIHGPAGAAGYFAAALQEIRP